MRVSLWKQDKLGAHWHRIGVCEMQLAGACPFKVLVSFREYALPRRWPRYCYHTMDIVEPELFTL